MKVAERTYYLNADKSIALPAKPYRQPAEGEAFDETPAGAAYLLVREGQEVTAAMGQFGVKGVEKGQPEAQADAADVSEPVVDAEQKKSATKPANKKK